MTRARAGRLLRVARLPFGGWLVGLAVERWATRLPVDAIYRDERVIAFHHPAPEYESHILIVPRKRIATLLDFNRPGNAAYLGDVLRATHEVLRSSAYGSTTSRCWRTAGRDRRSARRTSTWSPASRWSRPCRVRLRLRPS